MNNFTVQPLTEADKSSFERLYTETILSEFPEYSEKTRQYFSEGKYKENMWHLPVKLGAFAEGQLVGYLLCGKPFGGVAFVHWIAIEASFQGQGIGRQLLEELDTILKVRGVHNIQLQSEKKNIPFYEKCGYEVFGFDDKGYFGARDYHLRKVLQEPQEETFFS